MKVRLKSNGGYNILQKADDIVKARILLNGYDCKVNCLETKKKRWLYFTKDEVDVIENKPQPIDTIVESVINQFRERSEVGIKKYGVTLDRNDLSSLEWAQHLQEELCDGILYLEKLKQTL